MFTPSTCIDILYDYESLLGKGPLCVIPRQNLGCEVAVIGAGASGLIAAHELLKMGLKPVIYEASDRIGGRIYTKQFQSLDEEHPPFAELGAMRIPKSSRIFYHYANRMNLKISDTFPSAGKVDSLIYFKNTIYNWIAKQGAPQPVNAIKELWAVAMAGIITPIHEEWQRGNLERVRQLWQDVIDRYKDLSVYEFLKNGSPIWSSDQIDLFGSIGLGTGGFRLFENSILEILRIVLNKFGDDLYLITDGVSSFIEGLYHMPANGTSLAKDNCVQLNSLVIGIDYNGSTQNPVIFYKDASGTTHSKEYRAVIFTGSLNAAHLINLPNKTMSGVYLLDENVRNAIKDCPMMPASKTFICTKSKFWLEHKMPECIFTDDLPRMMCFLNYPHTQHGVVLLSYTVGRDSMKLHMVDPKDRVKMYKRTLESISSEINNFIVPLNDEVINIDWIDVKYQNGAFKLSIPGADSKQQKLYYQFLSCLSPVDKGVYLAGDSISWSGGWIEGALYTGLNSVYAVAKRLEADIPKMSPLNQDPNLFSY